MKLNKLANSLLAIAAVITTLVISASTYAQSQPGRAEVRAVTGTAYVSPTAGAPMEPLKADAVLGPGATIKTGPGSTVDLFLGNSVGTLRVIENSTLAFDKLTLTDTGADMVVEVQLNVPEGTILGNVHKLTTASKYEIKVPNGVAGIRGTQFRISSSGYIVLLEGTMIFVYVPPGGTPTPYTLVAPPAVYFSPIEGVKPAPDELVREVTGQLGPKPPGQIPGWHNNPPGHNPGQDPSRPGNRYDHPSKSQP